MITENTPLALLVEECFSMSPLSHRLTNLFLQKIVTYVDEHTLLTTESDTEMRDVVYNQSLPDEAFTITGVLVRDSKYTMQVFCRDRYSFKKPTRDIVEWVKNNLSLSGKELGEIVIAIHTLRKYLEEALAVAHRATRINRSQEFHKEDATLKEMQIFYECGRKQKYPTLEVALTYLESDVYSVYSVYSCTHCSSFHIGREGANDTYSPPEHVMIGLWKTAWYRYADKRL